MNAPKREQRSEHSDDGHVPDLVARYLAGEPVTEQLREMEAGPVTDFGTDARERQRLQQAPPAPGTDKPSERPTAALIAVGIALAMFAISLWIAFR